MKKQMTRHKVLKVLQNVSGIPHGDHRTIYEAGRGPMLLPTGEFFIDYSTYPGGSSDEVPLAVIQELEREGLIRKAFPKKPEIKAWVLA